MSNMNCLSNFSTDNFVAFCSYLSRWSDCLSICSGKLGTGFKFSESM